MTDMNGTRALIAGYCESGNDLPKDGEFPTWCPLKDETRCQTWYVVGGERD